MKKAKTKPKYKVGDQFYLTDDSEPGSTIIEITDITHRDVYYIYVHCSDDYQTLIGGGPFHRSKIHFEDISKKIVSVSEIWKKLNEA